MSTLQTLFVRNLIFSGVHGSTGRERLDSQRFQVDISVKLDINRSAETDSIEDTYDYKDAASIAKHIIENERHVLIERIATRIADGVCRDPKVHSAKVVLRKLDANNNGLPGIVVEQKRRPQEMNEGLLDFDIQHFIETLDKEGGVSIPILNESYRKALLEEAETYQFEKQPEIVGPAKVREQLSSTYEFRPGSLFFRLRDDFQNIIEHKLTGMNYPFRVPLNLNEMSLQLYEEGSIGITPHMDGMSQINLICVFVLTGHAKFALCKDREGTEPKYLDTTPGNVIIMRAPGFMDSDFRPFHFLTDVSERRIVFGLRQKA
jgi:dihydroneopterin aldolase